MKNKISIGTANFGAKYGYAKKKFNSSDLLFLKKNLIENHIKKIDTSAKYLNSENLIKLHKYNDFEITSKIFINNYNKLKPIADVENQIISLLKKIYLKNNKINILIHNSKLLNTRYGIQFYQNLEYLKKYYPINKIGISCYYPELFLKFNKILNIEILQFPLNIFDNRFVKKNMLSIYKKKKITLQARSIFLQGLLLNEVNNLPKYFIPWKKIFIKYNTWLKNNEISALDACINHIKPYKQISSFIFGINNIDNLNDIIKSAKKRYKKIRFQTNQLDNKLIIPYYWNI